uniref:Uncharacterized protein n=1 Tax=Rhizophora mucronata TaxID=61149 RepID=A0A2P2JXK4_RHIMU
MNIEHSGSVHVYVCVETIQIKINFIDHECSSTSGFRCTLLQLESLFKI